MLRQDRGDGFVLQDILGVFPESWHAKIPEVIKRLSALGYLEERTLGWWRVTAKGDSLRSQSEGRFPETEPWC